MARYEKVAVALQREVSSIIHDELKDPRLGFVTITRVELTQDLRYAKVFYSVLGKEQDYIKTKNALDSAHGYIRSLIAQRIRLRFAPEIAFKEDKTGEYSTRIQQVLDEIKELSVVQPEEKKVVRAKTGEAKRNGPKKSGRVHKKK